MIFAAAFSFARVPTARKRRVALPPCATLKLGLAAFSGQPGLFLR